MVVFTVPSPAFGRIRMIVILMSALRANTVKSNCVTGNRECKRRLAVPPRYPAVLLRYHITHFFLTFIDLIRRLAANPISYHPPRGGES